MKKVMVAYRKDGKWFYKISEDGGETWAEERVLNGLPDSSAKKRKRRLKKVVIGINRKKVEAVEDGKVCPCCRGRLWYKFEDGSRCCKKCGMMFWW